MLTTYDEVLRSASALPDADRAKLIQKLIDSLDDDVAAPLEDAWLAEVERRSEEIDSGTSPGIPWATVRATVRQKVLGHA